MALRCTRRTSILFKLELKEEDETLFRYISYPTKVVVVRIIDVGLVACNNLYIYKQISAFRTNVLSLFNPADRHLPCRDNLKPHMRHTVRRMKNVETKSPSGSALKLITNC
jgi:hypothetical protein